MNWSDSAKMHGATIRFTDEKCLQRGKDWVFK